MGNRGKRRLALVFIIPAAQITILSHSLFLFPSHSTSDPRAVSTSVPYCHICHSASSLTPPCSYPSPCCLPPTRPCPSLPSDTRVKIILSKYKKGHALLCSILSSGCHATRCPHSILVSPPPPPQASPVISCQPVPSDPTTLASLLAPKC